MSSTSSIASPLARSLSQRVPRAPARADGLTPTQRRAAVGAIVAVHVVAAWGLMQVKEVRDAVVQAAPIFVDMIAPPAPPAPPVPPPPVPKVIPKIAPAAPIVTAAPSPAPAAFVAPPPVVEQLPAPPVEAAPAPPAPPAPPRNLPASAVQYLEPPVLEYPRAARRAGETGRVIVRVYIDEGGMPRNVQVNRSSGFPRLDDAAIAAVQKARFRPYTENGHPTAGWALIPLSFDLEK